MCTHPSLLNFGVWSYANLWYCWLGKAFGGETFWSEPAWYVCSMWRPDMPISMNHNLDQHVSARNNLLKDLVFWLVARNCAPPGLWEDVAEPQDCQSVLEEWNIFGCSWREHILCPLTPISSRLVPPSSPPPMTRGWDYWEIAAACTLPLPSTAQPDFQHENWYRVYSTWTCIWFEVPHQS